MEDYDDEVKEDSQGFDESSDITTPESRESSESEDSFFAAVFCFRSILPKWLLFFDETSKPGVAP